MEKKSRIQVADRIFVLLEVLAGYGTGLGISELSRLTDIHKTTIFRILNALMDLGYVKRVPGSDKYQLSLKMFIVGSKVVENGDIARTARPFLRELANKTEEIVHLAVMDGGEAVYIDKLEGVGTKKMVRITSHTGKTMPMHCTGLGKVLLSGMEDAFVEAIAAERGLTKFTENTITEVGALKRELESIRERGYAIDNYEHEEGLICVAAPVHDNNGNITAAISLSYFAQSVDEERRAAYIGEVLATSRQITEQYCI